MPWRQFNVLQLTCSIKGALVGMGDNSAESMHITLRIGSCKSAAIAVLAVCWSLAAPLGAQAAGPTSAPPSKLASADWSVKASPNLASKPPPIKTLASFLNSVLESAGQLYPDIGESDVCSFAFKDLRRDGYLSLVAGIGVPDRSSCADVYIIDKTASGFEVYSSGGAIDSAADVSGSIKDLRRDGHLEFILDDTLAKQDECQATWPVIYAWTGSGYTNVSDRFKDFYRQQLDSLNKQIAAIQPFLYKGASYDRPEKDCLRAEAAKIQRFLGISSEAGLDQAIRFASNKYPENRIFAAQLLGKIGTPEAGKYLEILAKDSNGAVAVIAKYYLSRFPKRPSYVPAAFQHLQQPEPDSTY